MCGIVAIITKDPNNSIHANLGRAQKQLNHRGPDNQAQVIEQGVSFGHNRLSVFDLSHSANQPMYKNGVLIIYNGAVYNFLELKAELRSYGHNFNTNSDTEVIIEAYRRWGKDCVTRFNGMWAFVLYDTQKKRIFCSRDRFGIKPLYYYEGVDEIIFASEQKAIQQLVPSTLEIVSSSVRKFLELSQTHFPEKSFFKGIQQLAAGCNAELELEEFKLKREQYYSLEDLRLSSSKISFQEAKAQFRALFLDGVKLRLRADVDIGFALSGGIDSNSICAAAKNLKPDSPFECISACFYEKSSNEIRFIKDGIKANGHQWHPIFPESKNLITRLRQLAWFHDQPIVSASVLAQFEVFKQARQQGLKVMLDGQGADEILYGYDSFLKMYIKQYPLRTLSRFPLVFLLAKRKMLNQEKQLDIIKGKIPQEKSNKVSLQQAALKGIETNVLPGLLHFEDRNSMAHGIESRVPFLDHRLVEFCLDLPIHYFFHGQHRKYILKEALKDMLPKSIYDRKDKMPFSVPQGQWQLDNQLLIKKQLSRSKDILADYIHIDQLDNLKSTSKLEWRILNLCLFLENKEIAVSNQRSIS